MSKRKRQTCWVCQKHQVKESGVCTFCLMSTGMAMLSFNDHHQLVALSVTLGMATYDESLGDHATKSQAANQKMLATIDEAYQAEQPAQPEIEANR